MKYRKKPVEIEAVLANDLVELAEKNWFSLPEWAQEACNRGNLIFSPIAVSIKTLEGTMTAQLTDWIIQGVKGEIYSCKPDIFEMTYEKC